MAHNRDKDVSVGNHNQSLISAISSPLRSPEKLQRDRARKPLELFTFFGLKPTMNVVDIWPTKGWSTEILAPFLKDKGRLTAAHFLPNHPDQMCRQQRREFEQMLRDRQGEYGHVNLTALGKDHYFCAPPGSADMIITLRNYHNWEKGGYLEPVLQHFRDVLKPNGILAVEEHRADPDKLLQGANAYFYMHEDAVISAIEAAGFCLESLSEVGANPNDTRDHPMGPLSLPPTFWDVPDDRRTRFAKIGESDRMTLKFRKR